MFLQTSDDINTTINGVEGVIKPVLSGEYTHGRATTIFSKEIQSDLYEKAGTAV